MTLSESSQSKVPNCSSDLSFIHDEFVELLWDNGPVIHGQSNKSRKTTTSIFTPLDSKDNPFPKIAHFRAQESKLNNRLPPPGSLVGFGLNGQDDENVPWLNYPMEDSDFCSEFLNDFSGVNLSSMHSVPNASERDRIRPSQPFHSVANAKSSDVDVNIGTSTQSRKQNRGIGVMNFSHFSRHGALARANLDSVDRLESNNHAMAIEPPPSGLTSSLKTPRDMNLVNKSKITCEGDNSRMNIDENAANTTCRSPERVQSTSFAASAALGGQENEKDSNEAVVASSSTCSGHSHLKRRKRSHNEGVESGYQSEDIEDESVSLKKSITDKGKNKNRSRAAEVHNLSERRRRDRINERMRALQELIPNCNKTDKASMLDEAIEYLKSLQMQLQVMATGSALCIPPMMMQHMQQMRAPFMAPFSPMSIGMGMGMGLSYGMGMYDMNAAPGCSFISVPPIQGVPALNNIHMFGIPAQGLPVPMTYPPSFTSSADTRPSTVAATNPGNAADPEIK